MDDDEQARLTQADLARAAEWRKLQESILAIRQTQRATLDKKLAWQAAKRYHDRHRVVPLFILAILGAGCAVGWGLDVRWVAVPCTVAGIGWTVRMLVNRSKDDCLICQEENR